MQADPLTQNRYAFAGANPVNNIEFDGHDPAHGTYKNAPDSDYQVQTYGQRSLSRKAANQRRQRLRRQASAPSEHTQDFLRAPDRHVSDWAAQNLTARKAKRKYRINQGLEPQAPEGTRFGTRPALGWGGAVDGPPDLQVSAGNGKAYTATETAIASCLVTIFWCAPRAGVAGAYLTARAAVGFVRGQLTRKAAVQAAEQTAPRAAAKPAASRWTRLRQRLADERGGTAGDDGPNLIYEHNPKHGPVARQGPRGEISRAPRGDCQSMLECSTLVKPGLRKGVEPETGLEVIFRRHRVFENTEWWHGYVPGG
jgi:hypothetical protein